MARAWILLALAIALHVTDEALTGFLPVYNDAVRSIQSAAPWIYLPTFTFPVWIAGLAAGVLLMLFVTPLVKPQNVWMRRVAFVLGVIMVGNAIGHTAGSIYFERPMPGFWSSPFLLAASVWLLNQTRMSGRLR